MATTQNFYTNKSYRGWYKRVQICGLICLTAGTLQAAVTNLNDLSSINISHGETVNFSQIVSNITLNGEAATVTANFSDTSMLAPGRHRLIYTALTLNGQTAVKTTFLNVDNAADQTQHPVISGVTNCTFTESRRFDMLRTTTAYSQSAIPLVCRTSIPYPEQLAPGSHTLYYTAIDTNGNSTVTNANITILPLSDKLRRAEWNRLGKALYQKYFEPSRLSPYFTNKTKVYSVFIYGEADTLPGISAHISFRDISFDMTALGQHPMKIEALTARMTALLKELQHHRRLWFDQPYITFAIDLRGSQSGSGETKERGLYSVRIPNSIFQRTDFDELLAAALKAMPHATLRNRTDPGKLRGRVSHNLYEDPNSHIRILFEEDLIDGFAWNFNTQQQNGAVTLEEFFDADLYTAAYAPIKIRFNNGDFGAFTDPILPFIKKSHPNL
jgi:hypothetical protein